MSILPRKHTVGVNVGGVTVGGGAPIVVQSMTNTDTADIEATVKQVAQLWRAGSELVRITVDRDESAAAVPHIRDKLAARGINVPLIGDFHYIGHKLLTDHPACRRGAGEIPDQSGQCRVQGQARHAVRHAHRARHQIRQAGPHRRQLGLARRRAADQIDGRERRVGDPISAAAVQREAIIQSALLSGQRAEEIGLGRDRIIISTKVSDVQNLIAVYQDLSARCDYALHLGLTEAGMGSKGIVASSAAMGILLQQGIGDTIRVSLTPEPGGDRTQEVRVAQELLQTMGFRQFLPVVAACPGCGRTTSQTFQVLAKEIQDHLSASMPDWKERYPGVEQMSVAVMGCIVNGPGESKHADIGISLPGTGETPAAPVFVDGKKVATLRGADVAEQFKVMVADYIEQRFGSGQQTAAQ